MPNRRDFGHEGTFTNVDPKPPSRIVVALGGLAVLGLVVYLLST